MISRSARLCLACVLLSSGALAQTPVPPLPQSPRANPGPAPAAPANAPAAPAVATPTPLSANGNGAQEEMVSLKLPDADIDTMLSTLQIYTGKIILRPSALPPAPGGYNLMITKPVPKSEAILYIETILAMNGIAVIPLGTDALKVVPLASSRVEAPQLITGSTLDLPPSSKVASKLFQLDFLRVTEFQQMLQTVTNPNFGATTPLPNANAILVTDTITNLQRIETLLQQVDKPSSGGMATKFYQLVNGAKASDVVAKLHSILTGTIQAQIGQGTTYSADDRSNKVILITDPRQFPFFDKLIQQLDVRAEPNTRNEVIYLKHAKAADVAKVLISIIQGQNAATQKSGAQRGPNVEPATPTPTPPAPLGQPGVAPQPTIVSGSGSANPSLEQGGTNEFSSLVTIVNDDRSNSIVVSGTVDDIRLLQQLIDQLDIVLAQVRIEVVMVEVSLDDNHASGISQLGLQVEGNKLTGFSLAGGDNGAWPVTIGGIGNATVATIARSAGGYDLAGFISLKASPRLNNSTVLTVPAVVTSHGKEAVITDGQTIPLITGSTTYAGAVANGATSSQITQQQVGTTLTVTPYIGNDGSVQLDIKIELTDLGQPETIDGNIQYRINTRKTNSYISAQNGDIIVIGGFRQEKNGKTTSRLGGIPIIGDLLGPRSHEKSQQELIFFIRPTVLTNQPAVDNAEFMHRVEQMPTRDAIKQTLDPSYVPPKKSVLDKILRR